MSKDRPKQHSLFPFEVNHIISPSETIALELRSDTKKEVESVLGLRPELPARWEAARDIAESKKVLPMLLKQIRPVPALEYLKYLINLAQDEGYVWVVYGAPGSGKSSFFHTLEYQTSNQIRTSILDGNAIGSTLTDQFAFSKYLEKIIIEHKEMHGKATPLVIVLEERENEMNTEERSSVAQALRNVLRPPKPGKNVIFVLPVTNCKIRLRLQYGCGLKSGINEVSSTVSKNLWRQRGCYDTWNDQPFTT